MNAGVHDEPLAAGVEVEVEFVLVAVIDAGRSAVEEQEKIIPVPAGAHDVVAGVRIHERIVPGP